MNKTGIKDLDQYCEGVTSGKILACEWVKKAVARHYQDLSRQRSSAFPYYFEPKAAEHFFIFCETQCIQYEGVFNGKLLRLEPWQKFVFGSIFGWLKVDRFQGQAVRRYREAIIEIPKKQGKSFIGAAIALYGMWWDQMPGAQVYGLARNQQHALKLSYRAAKSMVEKNAEMKALFRVNEGAANMGIYNNSANAFFQPLTSKPESTDGLNIHMAINDETKDWDDFAMYNIVKDGTISMYNSLIINITTAGHQQGSLGFERRTYLTRVLDGIVQDDATYGIIYTIDKGDERKWDDPAIWAKAMPNFNVSVFAEALLSKIPACKSSPSQHNSFLTKHLNVWTSSEEGFVSTDTWNRCHQRERFGCMDDIATSLEPYKGQRAWVGLDMGLVSDFSSAVAYIEPDDPDERWTVVPLFWIPQDTIPDRRNKDIIQPWVDSMYIKATPGDVTDYQTVEDDIKLLCSILNVQEVLYDRYKLDQLIQNLQKDGIEVTPFGQGFVSMSPAIDALETAIKASAFCHGDNPVMRWMNSNVVLSKDGAENRKFVKDKAQDKIDGMVALAMAVGRATAAMAEGSGSSIYDEGEIRGFRVQW
jgi:phage terminase large subunit-like protein